MTKAEPEGEMEFTGRLNRDSVYRCVALYCATTRANLREHIGEDRAEVTSYAEYLYHWLKGNGDGADRPELEKRRET